MKKLEKNSKTRECLLKAFIGESGARNRYEYYSKAAKEEGFEQISAVFQETANNEKAHAKRFLRFLGEEFDKILINEVSYPIGLNKSTLLNLQFASNGEHEENSVLYPTFANIAESEGYLDIADNYHEIIEVEKVHEERFNDLIKNIKEEKVFKRSEEVIWKCRNCGYHHKGFEAPEHCPACKHPRAFFELFVKNY